MEILPIDFDVPQYMRGKKLLIGKPENMTDEQCGPLPAYKEISDDGFPQIISCWQIPDEALAQIILNKGKFWVFVTSNVMVPIGFSVINPFPSPEQVQAFLDSQKKEAQ